MMKSAPASLREPVLVFLHSPAGLRVEYDLDRARLEVWWSPGAGRTVDARVLNFSSRDVHLMLFESVSFPGCDLEAFLKCDYDPWKIVLHFRHQILTLSVFAHLPRLMIQGESPLPVEVVTGLADTASEADERRLCVQQRERGCLFHVSLCGPEGFGMRHSPGPSPGRKLYSRGVLPPGQRVLLEVGEGDEPESTEWTDHTERTEIWLAAIEAAGRLVNPADRLLERMRVLNQRGLAGMVDHSGAVRASIKSIYYLIWIRDAVFTAAGCVAAGWPHRLEELCALLLANPCRVREAGVPEGRMFAQLLHPEGGKLEEDGVFYAVWAVFLHWSHTGSDRFATGESLVLLLEAADWVDRRCFDSGRGLYGAHFADETPAWGARDHGWDAVTGRPLDGSDHIRAAGGAVVRSYDIYLNTLMHSVWSMLARMTGDAGLQDRADSLWAVLREVVADRKDGLPPYGDLVLKEGGEERVYAFGPVSSVYVWALTLPNFLPMDDRDAVLAGLLERLAADPGMHWNNGLCAAVAACDPWIYGEEAGVSLLLRIAEDAMKPGPWHPMGGAMPEKFEAPQGSLYHDIRPQAFAMGAWQGALASLGLRHLSHGLALRPTRVYGGIAHHEAFGRVFDVTFEPEADPVLRVNGLACPHTLQVPETCLRSGVNTLALGGRPEDRPLLLWSDARLLRVENGGERVRYFFEVYGAAAFLFEGELEGVVAEREDGRALEVEVVEQSTRCLLRLKSRGRVRVFTRL